MSILSALLVIIGLVGLAVLTAFIISIDLAFFIGLAVATATLVRESKVSLAGAVAGLIVGVVIGVSLGSLTNTQWVIILGLCLGFWCMFLGAIIAHPVPAEEEK